MHRREFLRHLVPAMFTIAQESSALNKIRIPTASGLGAGQNYAVSFFFFLFCKFEISAQDSLATPRLAQETSHYEKYQRKKPLHLHGGGNACLLKANEESLKTTLTRSNSCFGAIIFSLVVDETDLGDETYQGMFFCGHVRGVIDCLNQKRLQAMIANHSCDPIRNVMHYESHRYYRITLTWHYSCPWTKCFPQRMDLLSIWLKPYSVVLILE